MLHSGVDCSVEASSLEKNDPVIVHHRREQSLAMSWFDKERIIEYIQHIYI